MSDQTNATDAINAANAAIDRNNGPPGEQVMRTRRLLDAMNAAASAAIDDQVARSATAQHKALTGMLAAHGGHPGTSHSAGDYRQMVGSGTRGAKR
jgi:hypothetical protein